MDVGAGDEGIWPGYASGGTEDCTPSTHSMATRQVSGHFRPDLQSLSGWIARVVDCGRVRGLWIARIVDCGFCWTSEVLHFWLTSSSIIIQWWIARVTDCGRGRGLRIAQIMDCALRGFWITGFA